MIIAVKHAGHYLGKTISAASITAVPVVDLFDTITNEVFAKKTHQGNPRSAWVAAKAWWPVRLHLVYRETKIKKYSSSSWKNSEFISHHPTLLWGYGLLLLGLCMPPNELYAMPQQPAVCSSALLELGTYSDKSTRYFGVLHEENACQPE